MENNKTKKANDKRLRRDEELNECYKTFNVSDIAFMPYELMVADVLANNYVCPVAKNVIYDLNTDREIPILTTVVYFIDGTKISVRNNNLDEVDLVTKKLSDGSEIKVASDQAKERGYVYACFKRSMTIYENGVEKERPNLENFFKRLLKDRSHDLKIDRAEKKILKEKTKAEYAAKKAAAANKSPKLSIRQTLQKLNDILDSLNAKSNVFDNLNSVITDIKTSIDDIGSLDDMDLSSICDDKSDQKTKSAAKYDANEKAKECECCCNCDDDCNININYV